MRAILIILIGLIFSANVPAQDILWASESDGHPNLLNGDMAVLESGEPRKDLDCSVTPAKAALGFDMKFHSGYAVAIPLRELQGPANVLSILFRVSPKGSKGTDYIYFSQQFRVPEITESSGDATLDGVFDVGEGSYHIDWMMRDHGGRFCSSFWDFDAALSPKDKQMVVAIRPQTARPTEDDQFQPEPPIDRSASNVRLNVKVLMNFAPQRPGSAAVNSLDTLALMSILRNISRNPQIGKFSLVAFNIQEQRVLYRQDAADHIDFPSMGDALKKLKLGTVDMHKLENKHGDTEFLSTLIKNETTSETNPDGLIFIGPKALINASVPQEDLKEIGDLDYPVFYMNYTSDPQALPWKDAIGRMVKFFKGREYTITGPRDLWNAVTEVVGRMTKSKQGRTAGPTGDEQ